MKIMHSISQSIVDASRLDLSSPAKAIHNTGFDESNPYNRIFIARDGYFHGRLKMTRRPFQWYSKGKWLIELFLKTNGNVDMDGA